MDIYTADGDTEINRPVIIYMHGGSFTGGDKSTSDCVDFCESFAKRGYVTISMNYRLANNVISFLTSNETQFETVLKAVYDAKSVVRFLRKDFENGNNYSIDTSTIFVGGYSAGAVVAIHQTYIDAVDDLPSLFTDNNGNTFNVQNLATTIGSGNELEGDAGNYGFSSRASDFLFPLLPCNTITSTNNIKKDKKIIAIKNVLGESTIPKINTPLYYIFSDGTVEHRMIIE
jgi:carboxylesterase type B